MALPCCQQQCPILLCSGTSGFPCNLEGLAEHTASGAATPIQGPSPSPTQAGLKGRASGLGGGAAFEGNGPQVTCTSRLGGASPVDPKEEHARLVQVGCPGGCHVAHIVLACFACCAPFPRRVHST